MLNQKQEKDTCHSRAELIRHCFLFHESYWSFTFFSSSLFAPQPIQHVKRLITETGAAHSLGWLTKVPSSQHSHPSLLPTLQPGTQPAAGTALGEPMCLWAVAHQMCTGVMHCGSSDTLHPCPDPDVVGVGSKDSLPSVCAHEIIIVMRFRKILNIHAVKRHFPVMLTGTDTATAINLHAPGWKLIMGWSHCLPPLPPSRIVQSSSVFIIRGERGGRHLPLKHPAPARLAGRMLPERDMAVLQNGKSYSLSSELQHLMQPDVTSGQAYQSISASPGFEESNLWVISSQCGALLLTGIGVKSLLSQPKSLWSSVFRDFMMQVLTDRQEDVAVKLNKMIHTSALLTGACFLT